MSPRNPSTMDVRLVPPWEDLPEELAAAPTPPAPQTEASAAEAPVRSPRRSAGAADPNAACAMGVDDAALAQGSAAAAGGKPARKTTRKPAATKAAVVKTADDVRAEADSPQRAQSEAEAQAARQAAQAQAAQQRAAARAEAARHVQALDPLTLPLSGSRLIEASAGTGKTYTIAQLYVRLVLGHGDEDTRFERALTPPEILVVTFTDAATQELRDRIRQRLGQAAAVFEDDHPDWAAGQGDLLALRAQYAPEQWPDCAKLLRVAADWMDEAAVSTIHSWCYRMLREHAFDSGNLFTQTLITDESEMRLEAARDYWRQHFYALTHAEAKTLGQIVGSPEELAQEVKALLAHSDSHWQFGGQDLDMTQSPLGLLKAHSANRAKLDGLEDEARALWRRDWASLVPVFLHWKLPSFARTKFSPEQMQGWLADMQAWSEGEAAPSGTGKKGIQFFGQAKLNEYGKGSVPELPAFAAIDAWLDEQRDAEGRMDDKQLQAQLLAHATWHIHRALDQEKRRRAELSFDDVLRRLHSALTGDSGTVLADRIRAQFPVAMIDEFQDTDPIQWTMFDRVYGASSPDLSAAKTRALLLIGDPKQAIYGFRGADIHTYLQARQATQGRHYSLGTNFRSTQALVRSVNRVFDWAEAQWPEAAFRFADAPEAEAAGENPMPFVPVAAQGRPERLLLQGEPASALTWWWLEKPAPEAGDIDETEATEAPADAGKGKTLRKAKLTAADDGVKQSDYLNQMAQACASQITAWLMAVPQGQTGFERDGRVEPLRPRDMAVLVRSRKEADAIRHALSARGIASAYLSERESVFDSVEAQDFSVWLEAVHSDGQGSRLRAALATASLGRSHAWLERLNDDEGLWDEQVLRFRRYHAIWREHGVLPMTRALLHDYALPSAWLARPNGSRTLTNVLHLAEWLQKQAVLFDSQQALMRELQRQLDSEAEPSDGARLRLESDEDLIKVVTIHKSKGLEYPLVFLPFIAGWANPSSQRKSMVLPAAEAGAPRRVNLDVKDEADKALELLERQREDLRLLYVAMTRARHAMWLGVAPLCSGNARSCEIDKGALGYVLGGTDSRTAVGLYASLRALTELDGPTGHGTEGSDGPDVPAARLGDAVMQLRPMPEITPIRWQPPAAEQGVFTRPAPKRHWQHWWVASYSALTHGLKDDDSRSEPAGSASPAAVPPHMAQAVEPESVASEHLHESRMEAHRVSDWALADAELSGHAYGDQGEPLPTGEALHEALPPQGVHAFVRGATAGTFWHELLELCAMQGFARMLQEPDKLHELVKRRAAVLGWEAHAPALTQWLQGWMQAPIALGAGSHAPAANSGMGYGSFPAENVAGIANTAKTISLAQMSTAQAKPEMEFLLPVGHINSAHIDQLVCQQVEAGRPRPRITPTWLNGMLKGFMDLVFEAPDPDGTPCFYVLDYKSNWLGPDDRHYQADALRDAVLQNRYDLQGVLYQLALHRLLRTRLGASYDPERHLGGSITWFLRGVGQAGCGVWHSKAPLALLDRLEAVLEGRQP